MADRKLVVDIIANTKDFTSKLGSATTSIVKFGAKVAAAGVAAAGAFAAITKSALSSADAIGKNATTAGITAERLQELRFVMGNFGVTTTQTDESLRRFNRRLGLAAEGNKAYTDTYKELGVSIRDANGNLRGTEAVLDDTIQALTQIENDALRAARASVVFGDDAGPKLAAALGAGNAEIQRLTRRANELGLVLSNETVAASEEANQKLSDLADILKTNLIRVVADNAQQIGEFADTVITQVPNIINAISSFVQGAVTRFNEFRVGATAISGAIDILAEKASLTFFAIPKIIERTFIDAVAFLTAGFFDLLAVADEQTSKLSNFFRRLNPFADEDQSNEVLKSRFRERAELIREAAAEETQIINDAISQRVEGVQQVRNNAEAAVLAQLDSFNPTESSNQKLQEQSEIQNQIKGEASQVENETFFSSLSDKLDFLRISADDETTIDKERAKKKETIAQETSQKLLEAEQFFADKSSTIRKALAVKNAIFSIQSAIAGATEAGSRLPFPANLAAIAAGVANVIATTAGVVSTIKGQRASGGQVTAGDAFVVGEQGREVFVPNTNGSIIPNSALGSGINITVTAGDRLAEQLNFEIQNGQQDLGTIRN